MFENSRNRENRSVKNFKTSNKRSVIAVFAERAVRLFGRHFTFGHNGGIISIMGFGNRIKELRVLNALTQAQLAEKVGVDPSAVSLWENDINEPKASYIVRLALTFSVSADYILGIEDEAGSKLMR